MIEFNLQFFFLIVGIHTEATIRGVLQEKAFLKILQNSQLKKRRRHMRFPVDFAKF